jgi:hypothetical protein
MNAPHRRPRPATLLAAADPQQGARKEAELADVAAKRKLSESNERARKEAKDDVARRNELAHKRALGERARREKLRQDLRKGLEF